LVAGWGGADPGRIRAHAIELVGLSPDVILASTALALQPLLWETRSVPIVVAQISDPVGAGFIASLARPGGNLTGFTVAEFSMFGKLLEALIRDKPIAPGSRWQNSFAERLIGSIRRECVDHVIALGEQHLRRVLKSYASYYNSARTHRSLDKDSPVSRPVQPIGRIVSHALVGGLHHQYARI
jgi:Integrase core domain/ABC transporter substrate binding protein